MKVNREYYLTLNAVRKENPKKEYSDITIRKQTGVNKLSAVRLTAFLRRGAPH